MGVAFDDLEGLSVRQQRQIIKNRAVEMHRSNGERYKKRQLGRGTQLLDERLARSSMTNMVDMYKKS